MKYTMKRALTLMLAAALLTAVGCKQEEEKKIPVIPNVNTETPAATPSKPAESTTPPAPAEPAQPEVQDEILNEFYNIIEDSQRACAVAYLGYTEGPLGDGYGAWFEENGLLDVYPFLNDLPTERIIEQDGGEVYCIIPRQAEVEISVYSQNFDADGAVSVGDELFHSTDCQPFLVRGIISEIVPNTAVSIEYADGSFVEFSPALSGMDGRLALTEDQGILDMSFYLYQNVDMMGESIYWDEANVEGTWDSYALANDAGESLITNLEFYTENGNQVVFWYGTDYDNIIARYEGTFYESDIPMDPPQIMMELTLVDGSKLADSGAESLAMVVNLRNWIVEDGLDVIHLEGDPLMPGMEETTVYFTRTFG